MLQQQRMMVHVPLWMHVEYAEERALLRALVIVRDLYPTRVTIVMACVYRTQTAMPSVMKMK